MRSLASLALLLTLAACTDEKLTRPPPIVAADGGPGGTAASDGGVPRRPGVLRVATFNVRRYFDTVCETGMCGGTNFEEIPSQAAFEAMTDRLAKGIALVDPDVIALAEIETSRCLDALVAKLAAAGRDFPIAHLGETGAAGSVDVAILARGAFTSLATHRKTPVTRPDGSKTSFSRELLEIRMTFGAQPVVMFAAHFRSKVEDDPGRRVGEAVATQAIVAARVAELPEAIVLLAGDLNDTPGSEALNALEKGDLLVRVAKDKTPDEQATYTFNNQKIAIDHVYVGAPAAARYVPGSATTYRDVPNGFAGSDHAALAADFTLE
ncbi:MAG: endonuclease/exonuclease/phosphatase family protein [Labilithrix sp.]|nr:endonuclease/exonuclease/phosphatase family protein [Labilithrix sp.]